MDTLQVSLADDKAATSPFAAQVWRGVHISSRHSKAHELAAMRALVDRLHAAGVAYAVRDVWCDSNCCMYTVGLRSGAQAPWAFLEAQVQAWVDTEDVTASIDGEQLAVDYLGSNEGEPDEEDPCRRLAEDARALLLGEPSAVRARMARRLVEDLEVLLEAA